MSKSLKNKSTTFYVKRYAMSNVYISVPETLDLLDNLSPTENKLYAIVKGMVMESPPASSLKNAPLAKRLGIPEKSLANLKASLKKKGYLLILFGKDGDGDLTAQVFIGKDQMELYNLGIKAEIINAKEYKDLKHILRLNDPNVSTDERLKLVGLVNERTKD